VIVSVEEMNVLIPEAAQKEVDDSPFRVFKVVFIPADADVGILEEVVPQTAERALSAMIDYAKERFAQTKLTGTSLLNYKEQLLKDQQTQNGGKVLSSEAVQKLSDMTLCEVVPISLNSKKTLFIVVNLVVDDKAVSKNCPLNVRASSICARCGLTTQVRGDAFICRQFDNDAGFYRLNFSLKDLSDSKDEDDVQNDSLWISVSHAIRMQDASAIEKCAREYKERGNAFYKIGKFSEACWRYQQSEALLIDSKSSPTVLELKSQIFSNRSACKLKLGDSQGALLDSQACLAIRPKWNKAWGRLGEALKALGRDQEAKDAFDRAGLAEN